jgi:aryl-alcohol dehydrogenase-like predicted oxidoreductase
MIATPDYPEGCQNLALGTVQLGLPYGIANQTGQPDQAAATEIVAAAWAGGMRYFDTAEAYGSSEQVLGRAMATLPRAAEARIISKLKTVHGAVSAAAIRDQVRGSLERLGRDSLWGVLLHDEDDLDRWDATLEGVFSEIQAAGLIRHAGVSVYDPERAMQALQCRGIDLVQVPANIFDRRMARSGVFEMAAALGKQVFIRSVYLQGLALMTAEQVQQRLPVAGEPCRRLHDFCRRQQLSLRQFAIDHVRRQAPAAAIVIGAETAAQVRENCDLFQTPPLPDELYVAWTREWPEDCLELIDPRRWPPAQKTRQ